MPRVSIIIPTYNGSAYLQEALRSVLAQTYMDWEAVLVDDGSTDQTRAVVEAAAPGFSGRLHYIYQTNRGLAAARNTAIRHAKGDLLALLDSDDVWLPHRLDLGVRLMDSDSTIGLVHGKVARIDAQSNFVEYPPSPRRKYLEGRIARQIYTRRAHLLCPTTLFRKECINRVGLFDETMDGTADRDMWFRIAEHYRVAYIDEVVAHYRVSPGAMSSNLERMSTWATAFIRKHRASKALGPFAARQALGRLCRERGDSIFSAGQIRQSWSWYFRAVRFYPFSLTDTYMLFRALAEPLLSRFRPEAASVSTNTSVLRGSKL
jgi:glycosyltransferase involved in cell wall biosynthesis